MCLCILQCCPRISICSFTSCKQKIFRLLIYLVWFQTKEFFPKWFNPQVLIFRVNDKLRGEKIHKGLILFTGVKRNFDTITFLKISYVTLKVLKLLLLSHSVYFGLDHPFGHNFVSVFTESNSESTSNVWEGVRRFDMTNGPETLQCVKENPRQLVVHVYGHVQEYPVYGL